MIKLKLDTTSFAPVEQVYSSHNQLEPQWLKANTEVEWTLNSPFSAAKGVIKAPAYTLDFHLGLSQRGREVVVEYRLGMQLRSTWAWFIQPWIAHQLRRSMVQRIHRIHIHLDDNAAKKAKVQVWIGRWPFWFVAVILWFGLVFGSAAFFQACRAWWGAISN